MSTYTTIDYLSDLTNEQMTNARILSFTPYPDNNFGWDNKATVYGSDSYALLHSIYSFTAVAGATYDVFSSSYFDPYILLIYDNLGNAIQANNESDDIEYGYDIMSNWVAPYSGTYYVDASWHQGSYYKTYSLSIYEDIDTIDATNEISSSTSYTLAATEQNLILTGTAAINGTGNALNNSITGNSAANVINGMAGADTMTGGTGNDTYYVDNAGDIVTETSTAAAEIDRVMSTITYTLGANTENLTLTGTAAINGTGNTLANTITGNSGNNILNGGAGNDILAGGTGRDTLTGSTGNDTFKFNSVNESVAGINHDVITDFVCGTDKINLSAIDANPSTTGINDAFIFITGSAFTAAGQVRFASGIIYGNTDSNFTTAEFEIALTGITTLFAPDFVL